MLQYPPSHVCTVNYHILSDSLKEKEEENDMK